MLSGIRSAITVATLGNGRKLLVFADSMASIYALDPASLETVWQQAARIYETSVITGSISYHDDRLFVPVSSYEVAVSGSPEPHLLQIPRRRHRAGRRQRQATVGVAWHR